MKKILIANRGEIALRIARACRDAGYVSVAIASEPDGLAPHARYADELHILKGASPRETYLNQDAILEVAFRSGADAVHPGYGFLSENEAFAGAVEAAGLVWIGPPANVIAQLGDKVAARAIARKVGAPLLPSIEDGTLTIERARDFCAEHGLPVIVKAQNGGGGRGMRIVRDTSELEAQIAAAEREASIAFGRSECFIERYVEHARHVETQCLADVHGRVVVISTRDCTLQRRQQKLIEEAPAPFLDAVQNSRLVEASIGILSSVRYRGAATCEFLVTPEGEVFFLEVNTRVQVEHPVTEEVTGVDIIREMFRIAEGEHLSDEVPDIRRHAIEFRINAEDPWADFRPSPGRIEKLQLPAGPGIRLDFGYDAGDSVSPHYDSLVGKLVVTGRTRTEALARSRRALAELRVEGVTTTIPLHRAILERREFSTDRAEDFSAHTRWIDTELPRLAEAARALDGEARTSETVTTAVNICRDDGIDATEEEAPRYREGIKAPLAGMILELCVSEGDRVAPGHVVAVMEAMKMEMPVIAETSGIVAKINISRGAFVEMDADILGLD